MNRILTTLGFAMIGYAAMAQQDPQFTQYMFNRMFENPGYTGSNKSLCATIIHRQQWTGFDGNPVTSGITLDYALGDKRQHGVGINIMIDDLGFESTRHYRANYAYHFGVMDGAGDIGIGVSIGAISKIIGPGSGTGNNTGWLSTQTWQNDPSIPPLLKKNAFDAGLGVFFSTEKMHFGIASGHLAANNVNGGQSSPIGNPPQPHKMVYALARHYYIIGGYDWDIAGDQEWVLRPSFLFKSDAAITQFDLNANILMKQRFWVGASYRLQDAIAPVLGYQQPFNTKYGQSKLRIGLSYDVTTSQLKNYNNGTYEAVVNYCHPLGKPNHVVGHEDVRNFF